MIGLKKRADDIRGDIRAVGIALGALLLAGLALIVACLSGRGGASCHS